MKEQQIKKPEKKRNQPFEFTGQIADAAKTKVYGEERRGELYWKLFPDTNKDKVRTLFAFRDQVGDKIWQECENFAYYGRPLVFLVKKYTSIPGNYQLLQWRDI